VRTWTVGLESWVIQDGNYGDFERGQNAEFAVEFWAPQPLALTSNRAFAAHHLGGSAYDVHARVVTVTDRAWVIDCGIEIYRDESPPSGLTVGDWLRGTIHLGVDPFFYFERLHAIDGFPALVRSWRIDAISQQTGPFVQIDGMSMRDPGQMGWRPINRTDAWSDDDGLASYLFECTLLDVPPKRKSATAT
jgi:hypothetical protein